MAILGLAKATQPLIAKRIQTRTHRYEVGLVRFEQRLLELQENLLSRHFLADGPEVAKRRIRMVAAGPADVGVVLVAVQIDYGCGHGDFPMFSRLCFVLESAQDTLVDLRSPKEHDRASAREERAKRHRFVSTAAGDYETCNSNQRAGD